MPLLLLLKYCVCFTHFSVFVGVCSSICSPVIKLQSACCFTEQSTYTVYSQLLLVVGLTCLIWAFRVGWADGGGWSGFCSKAVDVQQVSVLEEKFWLKKFKEVSWSILWFMQSLNIAWFKMFFFLLNNWWALSIWKYLTNVKMWYIFHKLINWLSFTSPAFVWFNVKHSSTSLLVSCPWI